MRKKTSFFENLKNRFLIIFVSCLLLIVTFANIYNNQSWLGYERLTQLTVFLFCGTIMGILCWRFCIVDEEVILKIWEIARVLWIPFIIIQVLLVFSLSSEVGWDSGAVVHAALGDIPDESNNYLSIYPNNIFLVYIYKIWFYIWNINEKNCFMSAAVLNVISINISLALLVKIASNFLQKRYILLVVIFFELLIGLSPWIVIPYSDIISMPFSLIIILIFLWLEKYKNRHSLLKFMLLTISCGITLFVGYRIKPMIICIYPAMCLIVLFWKHADERLLYGFFLILSLVIMVLLNGLWVQWLRVQTDFEIDKEKAVSYTHFLMIGVNGNRGVYTDDDILLTQSGKTQQEKRNININEFLKRLKEMGAAGYINEQWKKICMIHSEGTFFWGGEGGMYFLNFDLSIHPVLRNLFYINGKDFILYKYGIQGIWLTILLFIGGNLLGDEKVYNPAKLLCFIMIMGIITFNLIFEARSRYLISFLPYYILASVCGIKSLRDCLFQIVYLKHKQTIKS